MRLDVTMMMMVMFLLTILDQSTKIPTPFKMLIMPVQLTKIQTPCKMLMRLDVTKIIGLVISTKILTPFKMLMLDHFLRIMKMKNSILLKEKISYLNLKMIDKCNFLKIGCFIKVSSNILLMRCLA